MLDGDTIHLYSIPTDTVFILFRIQLAMPSTDRATGAQSEVAGRALIDALRAKLRGLETGGTSRARGLIRSGCSDLDHLLPAGGFLRGSLVECPRPAEDVGRGRRHICFVVGSTSFISKRQACDSGPSATVSPTGSGVAGNRFRRHARDPYFT